MDQNRRNPGTEYLLQGSVLDDSVDILLHRLKGMCDNSEEGLTRFEEHEIVYTMRSMPTNSNPISVRVRKQLNASEKPCTLSYMGHPEIGDRNSLTSVRTYVETNCSQNVCTFLQELGFIVDFDYIRQGWLFRKNRIKATVTKVCRFTHSTNKDQLTPISKSHLVEVSTISNSSNEQASNDVHKFSEMLKPLVSLEKIDSRRLLIPARGCVKNYHWGKVGNDSYIARFLANDTADNGTSDVPLAELWFGSHPSGPATILVDKQYVRLDSFFQKHPEMVGTIERYYKFNKKLPFLFKILSVGQSLSLQAHPDKELAQILHKKDPKNYPDSNHKPELAIALTDFEILCDFRPYKEILEFMKTVVPFRKIVGEKNYEKFRSSVDDNLATQKHRQSCLCECFQTLMTTDKETIIRQTKQLLSAFQCDKDLLRIITDLDKLYPGDPGIFAVFFLNYIKLSPGQAVYLKANKLHAYLKGECIESMACSDNVVRAGLTTKYRDVQTLIKMLDYEPVSHRSDVLFRGKSDKSDDPIVSFSPTEEFKVDHIVINGENTPNGEYQLPALQSGSFIVVLSGKATTNNFFKLNQEHKLTLGSAAFIPPKIKLKLSNIQGEMTIYRAYC